MQEPLPTASHGKEPLKHPSSSRKEPQDGSSLRNELSAFLFLPKMVLEAQANTVPMETFKAASQSGQQPRPSQQHALKAAERSPMSGPARLPGFLQGHCLHHVQRRALRAAIAWAPLNQRLRSGQTWSKPSRSGVGMVSSAQTMCQYHHPELWLGTSCIHLAALCFGGQQLGQKGQGAQGPQGTGIVGTAAGQAARLWDTQTPLSCPASLLAEQHTAARRAASAP